MAAMRRFFTKISDGAETQPATGKAFTVGRHQVVVESTIAEGKDTPPFHILFPILVLCCFNLLLVCCVVLL